MKEVKEYKSSNKFDFTKNLEKKKYSIQFLPNLLIQESKTKHQFHKNQKIKSSYLIDIVHNLILKYYFKKDNVFNLSSIVLKEKYGHIYNYYIEYLVEKNILILIKNHLKGKNARIYKLSDSVINGTITRYKNEDRTLLKKYKNAVSLITKEDIESNKILPEVKRKLVEDLFHIEIDYSRSLFFLDSTVQDTDIYNRNKYSVECINDKHIFYHFDNYGRMHTNFTILKSFIRKNCLLIDGEETFEIDIKNSQPLFLCKLIELHGKEIVNEDEYELFKYLTMNGKFYQYVIDNSEIKVKKSIKECVYKVFFGKNYNNKHDTLFKKIFPTIHNFIKYYKKLKGGYKVLAYDLQNLESDLVFNKIVNEVRMNYPEIHLITVHDSIICSKKYKDIVIDIFTEKLSNEFEKEEKLEIINSEKFNIYTYV
jgi:hypothetical protein